MPSLARDIGTIPRFSLVGSKEKIEQARADRELRKSRLQSDLIYNFRSNQGDFVASSPAYPGLARGVSGGGVTGGQPPDDRNPSRPLRSYYWNNIQSDIHQRILIRRQARIIFFCK